MPLYRLGVTESGESEGEAQSVFLFTERGVYKPGDVVHLKGFARNLDGERSSLPAGKTLTITMTDAKGREVLNQEMTLSDFGSFEAEIKLTAETLGTYRVAAAGDGRREPDWQLQFPGAAVPAERVRDYHSAAACRHRPGATRSCDRVEIFHGQTARESEAHLVARGAG